MHIKFNNCIREEALYYMFSCSDKRAIEMSKDEIEAMATKIANEIERDGKVGSVLIEAVAEEFNKQMRGE